MRLKLWHGCALITLAVLAAYYPLLHAGFNSVDDLKTFINIDNSGPFDLFRHFFPDTKRYYYRPITTLTYIVDRELWGLSASFMHLENILLHLANALLVFVITQRIARQYHVAGKEVALLAALLFALHPLATEAVSWISGRTDPLSGVFILLTLWLLLVGIEARQAGAILLSGVTLLAACLTKEVAVFILPGLLWLVIIFPAERLTLLQRVLRRWLALLVPVAAIAIYFGMRHFAIARDTGLKSAIKGVVVHDHGLLDKARVALKLYGFYFKKLFLPWPLNFGIVEVSGWYVLAGLLLLIALLWCVWRTDLLGAFGLASFFVLSPALLVVYGKMAWTPIAERYLYAPVALFAPLAAILFWQWRARQTAGVQRRSNYALLLLFFVFFTTTLHRAWIWQDNLRLYADTVAKSPNFQPARSELASALIQAGRKEEAQEILGAMNRDSASGQFLNDELNMAKLLASRGDFEGARTLLLSKLDTGRKSYEILQTLLRVNDQRLELLTDSAAQQTILRESLSFLDETQRLRPGAFTLYRIGKVQVALGEKEAALASFRAALAGAPEDAHFRAAATKFIEKLENDH